jgi:hypothetical protein
VHTWWDPQLALRQQFLSSLSYRTGIRENMVTTPCDNKICKVWCGEAPSVIGNQLVLDLVLRSYNCSISSTPSGSY